MCRYLINKRKCQHSVFSLKLSKKANLLQSAAALSNIWKVKKKKYLDKQKVCALSTFLQHFVDFRWGRIIYGSHIVPGI